MLEEGFDHPKIGNFSLEDIVHNIRNDNYKIIAVVGFRDDPRRDKIECKIETCFYIGEEIEEKDSKEDILNKMPIIPKGKRAYPSPSGEYITVTKGNKNFVIPVEWVLEFR